MGTPPHAQTQNGGVLGPVHQVLCDIGSQGVNTQGQHLSAGHNAGEHCLHWKSAAHVSEQCHVEICPMPMSIGQMPALHMGFSSLKCF